jgi:hypothetical protein
VKGAFNVLFQLFQRRCKTRSELPDNTFKKETRGLIGSRLHLRFFGGRLLIAGLGVSSGALGPLNNFTRKENDPDP